MRYFITMMLLPLIFFTQCRSSKNQNENQDLPNDTLIAEVLTSVVLLDSIFNAHLGNHQLLIPYVYYMPKWDNNPLEPPSPPPLPPLTTSFRYSLGFSFDEAFSYFNSVKDLEKRHKDSIYIKHQVDTTITHIISEKVSSLFKNEKDDHYWLSLPIFSSDKRTAIVEYSEEYYFGYITVLKRVEGKWIKVHHDLTWMR